MGSSQVTNKLQKTEDILKNSTSYSYTVNYKLIDKSSANATNEKVEVIYQGKKVYMKGPDVEIMNNGVLNIIVDAEDMEMIVDSVSQIDEDSNLTYTNDLMQNIFDTTLAIKANITELHENDSEFVISYQFDEGDIKLMKYYIHKTNYLPSRIFIEYGTNHAEYPNSILWANYEKFEINSKILPNVFNELTFIKLLNGNISPSNNYLKYTIILN